MSDTDWRKCIEAAIQRCDDMGREEYLGMIDDVVAGMDAEDIATKHKVKIAAVSAAIGLVSASVHGPRPAPKLANGGWYGARENGGYEVAPEFAEAWKAARTTH